MSTCRLYFWINPTLFTSHIFPGFSCVHSVWGEKGNFICISKKINRLAYNMSTFQKLWLLSPQAESSDDSRRTTRLVTRSPFAIWCWLGSAKWDFRAFSLKATICCWGGGEGTDDSCKSEPNLQSCEPNKQRTEVLHKAQWSLRELQVEFSVGSSTHRHKCVLHLL